MNDREFKTFLNKVQNDLDKDEISTSSINKDAEKQKLEKIKLIIKTVFITVWFPIMFIIYFLTEKNQIMPAFLLSSAILFAIYKIICRFFFGKIDTVDYRYGDWYFFFIPIIIFFFVLTLIMQLLESLNFFNNDIGFLLTYAKYTRLILILIIAYFISRKTYYLMFNKKNSDSDFINKNNP